MPILNITFETQHGYAFIAKENIISIEDIDDFTSAITVKLPNGRVNKLYSTERAKAVFERVQKLDPTTEASNDRHHSIKGISFEDISYPKSR